MQLRNPHWQELLELLPHCLRQDRIRLQRHLHSTRPERLSPPQLTRWLSEAKRSIEARHRRHERLPQIHYPAALPIASKKEEIVAAIRARQVIVVAGETGSGKTTQIPKMCLEAGLGFEGKIACTQPRRVAALSISRRVAAELNVAWGKEVGCTIRFSDQSSSDSYIKFMTDGILLAETQADPDLNEYDAIIIDEAHERSLNIDFLLGHLKSVLARRPELKLVVTSATIDTEAFSKHFDHAPIVEVSGRLYPVEVEYAPINPESEESGEWTYIDASVDAVRKILHDSGWGDILIFMPAERDIRELSDLLEGRWGERAEIIPLFGRLTGAEQDRAFSASQRRKIIIATNIAETSLTIPGIRYVLDSGLARVSRYNPRTRTKRLPIEPISQSSANQRAGRCGRIEHGVCIRLFSELDFAERPKFTQPEIQRANLAEVILRMKAFRLGEIEGFPFVSPPQPAAIESGYQLLHELGALDEARNLTPLGRDLARLPVDPAIGRMILQSIREGALEEVLIIASGLSIQDPRERPLDKQEGADAAHRQFIDPDSDFLGLLNIWNAFHDQWDACKTQNQLRKFCKAHFLSYVRMREWREIHRQLEQTLSENMARSVPALTETAAADEQFHRAREAQKKKPAPNYAAIHRSILSGLLGHIGCRTEKNMYRGARNRELMLFPGSSLFERQAPKTADSSGPRPKQPEWIVAGEIVETSRLFARTAARIAPAWLEVVGAHVCKRSVSEPVWDSKAERVLAWERITLFGLTVQERRIDFGKVDSKLATEIFIRSALVEEEIDLPHRFVEHNRRLRQKIEVLRTRSRNYRMRDPYEALFDFYSARLEGVSSVHDLNRLIRDKAKSDPGFLCAAETDLGGTEIKEAAEALPDQVKVAGHKVQVRYAYAPGEEHDGVTLEIPAALTAQLESEDLQWLIPGLRTEQIEAILKTLPKEIRSQLMPLNQRAEVLAKEMAPGMGLDDLRALIARKFQVQIPSKCFKIENAPVHLRPRIALLAQKGNVVASSRDLAQLKQGLAQHETPAEQLAWNRAVEQWERYDLTDWSFPDPPEKIEVASVAGVPFFAFPGLQLEGTSVHLRLFRTLDEAQRVAAPAWLRLLELSFRKELAWAEKDLRALDRCKDLYLTLGPADELKATAVTHVKRTLFKLPEQLLPLRKSEFERVLHRARAGLPDLLQKLVPLVGAILQARQELLILHRPYAGLRQEIDALVPKDFLARIPYERLQNYPRYLKTLKVRAERAALNPAKDQEKAKVIQPFVAALHRVAAQPGVAASKGYAELWELLEEFKVSVFAQELGTAQPVSAKRLNAKIAELEATF